MLTLMLQPARAIGQQVLLEVQINDHPIGKIGEFMTVSGSLTRPLGFELAY